MKLMTRITSWWGFMRSSSFINEKDLTFKVLLIEKNLSSLIKKVVLFVLLKIIMLRTYVI